MKSKTYNGEVRSSEKDFEFTVGCLRYSRFAPRSRARRFNSGIGLDRATNFSRQRIDLAKRQVNFAGVVKCN
jgi:hypothetical protein